MSEGCCGDDEVRSDDSGDQDSASWWQVWELQLGALAGGLLLAGFVAGRQSAGHQISTAFYAVALAAGAFTFVPGTVRRLLRGRIGVGTLMTIAAVGATILGQVGEAAALAFLYSISEGLEEYSLARTRTGLRALLSLVPSEATVLRGDIPAVIPAAQLLVGDLLLVKAGERVATDGLVRAGRSALDNAALTGESIPVETSTGDPVYAGAINGTGTLEVEVTSRAEDNSLARIVRIVEEEQARKGAGQRLADRIAAPLVPGIMVLAGLIAVAGSLWGDPRTWIERSLVVLVAASPCALAIAVPVTVVAAIGAASRIGVLVKGGAALEGLGAVRTIALDKTGTLTRNRPTVTGFTAVPGQQPERVLALAAALEARSEHPLARAILAAAPDPQTATDVETITGAGIVGVVDRRPVRLGRPGWLTAGALAETVAAWQEAGATAVLVEEDGQVIGAIAVRDELRPEAAEVVARLQTSGYTVAMLTGDNQRTAAALARDAGISEVYTELRPEDKADAITQLRKGGPTAMVGDGVNDAPALATADVGIAMGAMGTDVAIETADVALMGQDLRHLPQALDHARRSRTIIRQNIGLSLALIAALIPLAAFGVLGLATVVAVHELAEIIVIANGIRASRATPLPPSPTASQAARLPDPAPA